MRERELPSSVKVLHWRFSSRQVRNGEAGVVDSVLHAKLSVCSRAEAAGRRHALLCRDIRARRVGCSVGALPPGERAATAAGSCQDVCRSLAGRCAGACAVRGRHVARRTDCRVARSWVLTSRTGVHNANKQWMKRDVRWHIAPCQRCDQRACHDMMAAGLREVVAPASLTTGCLRFLLLPTGCWRCCTAAAAAVAGAGLRRGSASAAETTAGAAAASESAAGSGGQGGASTGGEDSLAAAAAAVPVSLSLQPSELSSELLLKPRPFARPPAAGAVGLTAAQARPLPRRLLEGRFSSAAPTSGGGDAAAVGLAPRAGLRSPEVARASLERWSMWCWCRRRWLRPRAGLCAGAARGVGCRRRWRPQSQESLLHRPAGPAAGSSGDPG